MYYSIVISHVNNFQTMNFIMKELTVTLFRELKLEFNSAVLILNMTTIVATMH